MFVGQRANRRCEFAVGRLNALHLNSTAVFDLFVVLFHGPTTPAVLAWQQLLFVLEIQRYSSGDRLLLDGPSAILSDKIVRMPLPIEESCRRLADTLADLGDRTGAPSAVIDHGRFGSCTRCRRGTAEARSRRRADHVHLSVVLDAREARHFGAAFGRSLSG